MGVSVIGGFTVLFVGIQLTVSGIASYLRDIGFSAADAEDLGVHLDIPWSTMKTLKKTNAGNPKSLLYDVIGTWLDHTEPTSDKLVTAVHNSGYKLKK